MPFTYEIDPKDPETHAIHAKLPIPVPEGGIGRVLIYKTYKDPRTYKMNGDDIVWVRSLSGYRLGVLLPKGFAFLSSNVAAQMSTTSDGRLKLAFANPSGQSNPVTIHARRTSATFTPTKADRHVLRRCEDAVRPGYAGVAPHRGGSELQRLPQGRQGDARLAVVPAAAGSEGGGPRHGEDAAAAQEPARSPRSPLECRSPATSRARTCASPAP